MTAYSEHNRNFRDQWLLYSGFSSLPLLSHIGKSLLPAGIVIHTFHPITKIQFSNRLFYPAGIAHGASIRAHLSNNFAIFCYYCSSVHNIMRMDPGFRTLVIQYSWILKNIGIKRQREILNALPGMRRSRCQTGAAESMKPSPDSCNKNFFFQNIRKNISSSSEGLCLNL